jgi:hypothetical protein
MLAPRSVRSIDRALWEAEAALGPLPPVADTPVPQEVAPFVTRVVATPRRLAAEALGPLIALGDTSQMYLYFLMLHACFYTIFFIFCYTSWHFYAFSGTNLLTRCHSANSLFSAVFVFQKSYTGNILEIGRNKSRTS